LPDRLEGLCQPRPEGNSQLGRESLVVAVGSGAINSRGSTAC
jgi:hypothetical protein